MFSPLAIKIFKTKVKQSLHIFNSSGKHSTQTVKKPYGIPDAKISPNLYKVNSRGIE